MLKRIAMWALIAALVWWVIQDPAAAAHLVHSLGGALSHAAACLSTLASEI
jgi:hypothetical protein